MAVTFLNTNTADHAVTSPFSKPMSVTASGSDRCAFVSVAYIGTGLGTPTATYNSVSMTLVDTPVTFGSINSCIFVLVNPSTGSNTLEITISGTISDIYGNLVAYNGVDQITPVRPNTYTTNTIGSLGDITLTVSSNPKNLTMSTFSMGPVIFDASTNQTLDGSNTVGSYCLFHDHATTGAASIIHNWGRMDVASTGTIAGLSIQDSFLVFPVGSGIF